MSPLLKIFFRAFLLTLALLNAARAESSSETSTPTNISPPSEFNLVQIDTMPLPELKRQVSVARLPSNALMDAFGLPMFVPIEKTRKGKFPADIRGGEIGRIVNRISINGVLPNHEVIIETYIVPLGSSFAVKIKEKEIILLHVQEVTDMYIDFGWSKDDAIYRYMLPEKEDKDIYIEDVTPEQNKQETEP